MYSNAAAQGSSGVTAALQLALKLEYLEAEFYRRGLAAFGPGGSAGVAQAFTSYELGAVQQIAKHENAHVATLKAALGAGAPAQPAAGTTYDYSAGSGSAPGPFPAVFTQKREFFKLAQLFEDAGVRAYKGQLTNLKGDPSLATVLRIHAVEARHAAEVRFLRTANGAASMASVVTFSASIAPWITGASYDSAYGNGTGTATAPQANTQGAVAYAVYGPVTPLQAGVQPASAGEDNIIQLGVTVTASADAFDEPLATSTVVAFMTLFNAQ
jgi:ferritin-like protein